MLRAMLWTMSYMIISGFALTELGLGRELWAYWYGSTMILGFIWFNNARIREEENESNIV